MSTDTLTPEVTWAQRSSASDESKNFVYLTIVVPDVPKDKFKLELKPTTVAFTGYSNTLKRTYHVELELYAAINEAASKVNHTNRDIELKLIKKDLSEDYWPRLLKEPKKVHFLKTDFDKWLDQDEQNEAADDDFSQFGGMGGMPGMGGMGDMGGMGGMGGDFGGIDFSKLGGGAGLGDSDNEGDNDDDEMPALEGEEEGEEEGAATATPEAAKADASETVEAAKTETKA